MNTFARKADPVSRRQFVTRAAQSFLGVSVLSGFGAGRAGAALGPQTGLAPKTSPARSIIYLYMSGGMTHLDTFDPRPGHENQGPVKAIKTNADGIQISEYLPLMARHMDKVAVINGLSSTAGAHAQGNYFMHTSYDMRATIRHPGIGAWLQKFRGRVNPNLPGSVYVGGSSKIEGGAGFFESEFEPLAINEPTAGLKNSKRRGIDEMTFDDRLALAGQLDSEFRGRYDLKATRAYASMYGDAVRIMKSADLEAFNLAGESAGVREAYGEDSFGQGCLLARRLVEHQVRAVEVTFGGWDTHSNNFVSVPDKCAILDQALSTLLEDLKVRGLLEETLVVLATEFGRTPRINQNAGRDHYPKAFTSLLAGGGIKGGIAYGKKSEGGEEVVENQITIPDFNATIAYALGLPIDQVIYSPSKRPFTVAHKGKPVLDVIA